MRSKKHYSTAFDMFKTFLLKYKRFIFEGIGATILINVLALATSMFSMQVYDRVIPTHGLSTLTTLSIGVLMMIIFEFVLKLARSNLMDNVIVGLDTAYAYQIYKRLLSVRLDQMPSSIGSLSSQLKSYETIRSFLTASTLYMFVDTPFALIYIFLLALIGSPWIALVSLSFFSIALVIGLIQKHKIKKYALEGASFNNKRLGELVETIQGIEIIKASNGENKFLSRWMKTSRGAITNDLTMRHINEDTTYIAALLQQLGYASIIIVGAYLVTDGVMSMGALIACTIISGRIMAPVAALPGLFSQLANAKASLDGIEQMYKLKLDTADIEKPLTPAKLFGSYTLKNIEYVYAQTITALKIPNFEIKAGEKIAIVGSIGSGKSTLLKILTGMYFPEEGKVFIDNLDLSHINRSTVAKSIGYMPQDNRLFQGTIKENLIVGLSEISDDEIKVAAETTGLINVINEHPKGFDLPISEGGFGLSSGQRQLVAITRLIISKPSVWLLDEPTASMDGLIENKILAILKSAIQSHDTAVIVTHKPALLSIVDKIIVVSQGQIALYGSKEEVLSKLNNPINT